MQERYSRNVRLFGEEGQKKISESSVAVFGVGGVGSYAAEALARAGFGRDVCERVVRDMLDHGYIDEKRQLERIILVEANTKLRGPMKIIPALAAKGYSTADIREVMSALVESGELDFKKNAKTLLDKKLPDADGEEKKKFLYKNGYKV